MTVSLHQEILGNLWRGHNPYYGFPYKTVKPDLQGWASQHRFLMETVATRRPKIVVEVGVWKGASVIELAQSVRANGLDAVVIAVDTWLGAWDHWTNDQWHGELGFEFGFPTIYRTFLANVITAGLQDIVIPLPLDSVNAQHTLKGFEIFPDLVHIDGAHDFDTVMSDLTHWWSVLTVGGTIIMDDYFDSVPVFPDVLRSVRTFLERVKYTEFEAEQPKCRFVKCTAEETTLASAAEPASVTGIRGMSDVESGHLIYRTDGQEATKTLTLLVHPAIKQWQKSLVQMFSDGLREISIEPELMHELPPAFAGQAIVLGANFFSEGDLRALSYNSIIFNMENSDSHFMTSDYIYLLKKYHAWDYDERNAKELSRMISRPVRHLKMFYVESLSRISDIAEPDIDVLFYGSFNSRREAVLDALRARGLNVTAVFRVFDADLDELITRSKVVLNLHYYENGRLEMIRLFDLLANRRAIMTELNPTEVVDADLTDAFVTAPYERLVDVTEALVRDAERRYQVGMAGFEAFSHRRANTILREAIASSETPMVPSSAVIGSGKYYDPNILNIDIDERWHPDVVADISDHRLFEREFLSQRFGTLKFQRGWFDCITASHVLEHLPDLVAAMTNCLDLLTDGGLFRIAVPYDLSYGAWQDPTHVHAFNERSWLYYCEWYWYLGWTEARFDLTEQSFRNSAWGDALAARGVSDDEILRSPRAIDEMSVVLRKRLLTEDERAHGRAMRGDARAIVCSVPSGRHD